MVIILVIDRRLGYVRLRFNLLIFISLVSVLGRLGLVVVRVLYRVCGVGFGCCRGVCSRLGIRERW